MRHKAVIGYVFIVLVASWGIAKSYQNANHIANESRQRDYASCVTANDGRKALKDVIVIATASGQTPDLTKMPSYATLSPAGQQFVRELNAIFQQAGQETTTAGLKAFAETNLQLRNCEEILK